MHKMAAFNKKKYLLVSTLSTSLSILLLLLKLNLVNLCKAVNHKCYISAWVLKPATLLKKDSGTGVFLWISSNFQEYIF